ncbi:MAG: polysaccharide biosynthesis protein [Bacteroidetes bacterium]|nr:MAG: polysaccharide biosynthesis protein [Bacteroidota bacterium]
MDFIKKLAGQTAVYGLSSIVGRLLNYLLVPLYTAAFADPKDYGVVSDLYAWVAFLVVLLTFGMETSFFRFLHREEDPKKVFRNSFLTVIGVNGFFLLLVLFFHQSIAEALLYPEHSEYIILLGLIVAIDAISAMPLAKLRAEEQAKRFALVQFSSIAVNVVLNLILMLLVFDKSRPEEGVLFILLTNLLASLVKPVLLYRDFIGLKWRIDRSLVMEMTKYAVPLVIAGFAGIINETVDRILLRRLLFTGGMSLDEATAQVGIYSAVYKLAMLVTIFIQAYRYAAEPFFFAQTRNEDREKIYGKIMNFFVAGVCFVFLLVSVNIDIFKHFIRNETYWVGLGVVPILLLANVFLGVYYNQSIWYKLSGQTRFGAYIAVGGASVTLALNILLIPSFGYWACAWVTLLVYAGQMVASYFLGQRHYPIKYNIRKFFLYVLSSLLLFALSRLIEVPGAFFHFLIQNLLVAAFVGLVWYMEKPSSGSQSPEIPR